MFEDIFRRKRLNAAKLPDFGFVKSGALWLYETDVSDGAFRLLISVSEDGEADTELIEKDSGEPYILYKTGASGPFVGEIRGAIEAVLSEIVEKCYESAVFRTRQAEAAIRFVRDAYGDEPEYLWTKFPDNAVWRRKDNKKWYGVILTVVGRKIGLDTDRTVEIIDLRMSREDRDELLSRKGYYPGWHMNKNSWYTVVLDGEIPDAELESRISESYALAGK